MMRLRTTQADSDRLGREFSYNFNALRPQDRPDVIIAKRVDDCTRDGLLVIQKGICL
jgi:hypothetical protein